MCNKTVLSSTSSTRYCEESDRERKSPIDSHDYDQQIRTCTRWVNPHNLVPINILSPFAEASIQFIQAVKLYDSNSSLLITVLNSLLTDYQDTSLAIELLKFVLYYVKIVGKWCLVFREICETNFVAAQADNASAKTMATFIIDMARLDPHIIRTNIDQITDLLTAEVISSNHYDLCVIGGVFSESSYSCCCSHSILFCYRKTSLIWWSRWWTKENAWWSSTNTPSKICCVIGRPVRCLILM